MVCFNEEVRELAYIVGDASLLNLVKIQLEPLRRNDRSGGSPIQCLSTMIEAWFKVSPAMRDAGVWFASPRARSYIDQVDEEDLCMIRRKLWAKLQCLSQWDKVLLWGNGSHVKAGSVQAKILYKFYNQLCEWSVDKAAVRNRYIRHIDREKILVELEKEIETLLVAHPHSFRNKGGVNDQDPPCVMTEKICEVAQPELYRHPTTRAYGMSDWSPNEHKVSPEEAPKLYRHPTVRSYGF